jgi:hypothetical protein
MVGGGIYNAPINVNRVDWSDADVVAVVWRGELATYDGNRLTNLVLLCHAAKIRCSIEGVGPGFVRLLFHRRQAEGGVCSRHPSMEEALRSFDVATGPEHRVRYRGAV